MVPLCCDNLVDLRRGRPKGLSVELNARLWPGPPIHAVLHNASHHHACACPSTADSEAGNRFTRASEVFLGVASRRIPTLNGGFLLVERSSWGTFTASAPASACEYVWAVFWLGGEWTGRVSATVSVMIWRPTPAEFSGDYVQMRSWFDWRGRRRCFNVQQPFQGRIPAYTLLC
ncbi:hypothetical protein CKAH01_02108 [Colletotrichum kahawae]|uniref:Uncharacterized protein n=1 Tax=Colletotrichum kahawae TaxID=34407 RepID=A0AAD9Y3N1_COLKA|nr:hypothetical protein CKAH01_02108 [Colletotrichum kahawae]